jgi:hypothetical protein
VNKKSVEKEVEFGQVLYKVPDTMQVMKNYDVIIRISKSKTNLDITENIKGKVVRKNIKTTSKMEVTLVDPTEKAFKIITVNSDRQIVDSTYTEWLFNVTPIKPGNNKLNLVISIFKNNDLKQTVYSDVIYVKANVKAEISNFWYDNWKWLFEKMIIPILSWVFGIWIGRKTKKNKE